MGFAFNPAAYLISLAVSILILGVAGAFIAHRWRQTRMPVIVALALAASLEYWFLVSPSHAGVEAGVVYRSACAVLALSFAASVLATALAAARRPSRPAA